MLQIESRISTTVIENTSIEIPEYTSDAFDNVEYQVHMSYSVETDPRLMSFVESRWGIEVTGGVDQFEKLTIVNLIPTGMARRAGMRIGDEIIQINDTPAEDLTFNEALELFRKAGRYVRVYVRGDVDDDGEEDWTCDFWFKPRKPWRRDFVPIQWDFPWNDKRKPIYKESNCFMVPSKMEEKIRTRRAATSNVAARKKKEESMPHTRSLTPSPRHKNQPGPNLMDTVLKPRNQLLPPTK